MQVGLEHDGAGLVAWTHLALVVQLEEVPLVEQQHEEGHGRSGATGGGTGTGVEADGAVDVALAQCGIGRVGRLETEAS